MGYTAEVTNLSPIATEKDVHDFFSFCGAIEHVEILRSGEYACAAYVTFRDAYSLETSLLLSGATIIDQCVCIRHYGQTKDDFDYWNSSPWKIEADSGSMHAMYADPFVSSTGEAVTMAQEVVKSMVAKGYVLSKDAYYKAKAFDESYKVSAMAAAKIAELSKRIGLTDKIKSVDEKYHVYDATKFVVNTASAAATAASTAATAAVNSSYFASAALFVSAGLTKAAKVAADLGGHGNEDGSNKN